MPRTSPETKARQLAETEEAMVKLRTPFRVIEHIGAKWKASPRTVERWMKAVRAKWRADREAEPDPERLRQQRRDRLRASLETACVEAMTRQQLVKDDDGKPVLDEREFLRNPDGSQRPNPNHKRPMTRIVPDLQRYLHALNQMRHLDGLDEPVRAQLSVTGLADSLPDVRSLPPGVRAKLEDALRELAPGGDLSRLAGDLFAAAARDRRMN